MVVQKLFFVFISLKLIPLGELRQISRNVTETLSDPSNFCPTIFYNNNRSCNFRNSWIDENLWRFYVNEACYRYANPIRFSKKLPSKISHFQCENTTYHLPVLLNEKGFSIIVDYTNATSLNLIRKTFKNEEFFHLWFDCCLQAERCCQDGKDIGEVGDCPKTWDGWSCFPATKPFTLQKITCSNQAYSSKPPECVLESQKQCFANGVWNVTTDYSTCAIAQIYRKRLFFRSRILYISIFICLPAVLIFLCSKKLNRITRMVLHRNLLVVIVFRYILTVLAEELVLIPSIDADRESVLSENGVGCRILSLAESLTLNAMYSCMLADGYYLHHLIVRNFSKEMDIRILYIIVTVLSFLPSSIWAISKWMRNSSYCWMVDENGDQWIGDGFRLSILLINVLFLFDIIRNIVNKLKHGSSSQNSKTTLKATFFLVFLFGIPILLFADTSIIAHATCSNYLVFKYASYINEGLQGVMVAILFCYTNNEVQHEVTTFLREMRLIKENNTHHKYYKKARTITYTSQKTEQGDINFENEIL
ncbi:calcitonin gene-related peptide type 1 receptor-like [Coccinella septempunctata]|uniref:calcitonin gene-related peptide type 1 receptor-like n=1 Tax=Coccinella septempunctata TaxID=41139 RepID=UPI001D070978|nr:calcitonin gene-related peptide type 1 receptor-like [Coccinella septempunctata]